MSPWTQERGRVLPSRVMWRGLIVFAVLLGCAALVLSAVLFSKQSATSDRQTVIVRHNHHAIHKVNHSLCALREDLQHRVDQTEKFLHHPESFPAFNDPHTLALIKTQVEGQQRTIDALSSLNCR